MTVLYVLSQELYEAIGNLDHLKERELADKDYLMAGEFSVTDIIVGYALNLGRGVGFLGDGFPCTNSYLDRLYAREHCALTVN